MTDLRDTTASDAAGRAEVAQIALATYRRMGFRDLAALAAANAVRCESIRSGTGLDYNVEIQFFWDDKRGGPVRVLASVDDGSIVNTLIPSVGDEFIMTPDGEFLDE